VKYGALPHDQKMKTKVVFVGAGPGDPELLTVRGKREIEDADVIIYAGSLIHTDMLKYARGDAILIDSHGKNREEIFAIYEKFAKEGKKVVRLHSGDLSFYSAIQEQMEFLILRDIPFEIIPGVTSFSAASASLKREFTSPGVSQTLIITKPFGKTGKPEKESIKELSDHGATMIIFLGIQLISDVVSELRAGYPPETPVAVVHKASWREEKIIRGTLKEIAEKVEKAGIKSQSVIIVGEVLEKSGVSKLYSGIRNHEINTKLAQKDEIMNQKKIAIFSLAQKSVALAEKVKGVLSDKGFDAELICSEKISCEGGKKVKSIFNTIRESFRERRNIVAILPMGVVVRAIEPKKKTKDPWVICIDERGKYVIPVLNGHRGANKFSKLIAEGISAQAVITTSD